MNGHEGDERWREDLAVYMLGALDPGEAAELERHLRGCERCRAEMRWLEPAVRSLPEAVERREPPRALRDSLMAEVRADARQAAAERRVAERPAAAERGWLPSWLGSRGLRWAGGLAVAALLIAAIAGYEVGKDGGAGGGGAETTLSSRQPSGIEATMVREGDGGTLRLANVDQLPPQKVLEAWVRREGRVEAVPALFVPDSEGRATTTIGDMRGVDTVMVTEEPQGGSKTPTSEPIVTIRVPQ